MAKTDVTHPRADHVSDVDAERRQLLSAWFQDQQSRLARTTTSVCARVWREPVGLCRGEDVEAAIYSVYFSLLDSLAARPEYGIDRVTAEPSARAVRGLANRRLADRLVDQARRVKSGNRDVHVYDRINLVHLDAQLDNRDDGAWGDIVADLRSDTHATAAFREMRADLRAGDRSEELIALAPALGIGDRELAGQIGITEIALRQRRSRLLRRLRAAG